MNNLSPYELSLNKTKADKFSDKLDHLLYFSVDTRNLKKKQKDN